MFDSHKNGAVSESVVEARLHRLGFPVSVPTKVDCPYDLIVDIDGDLVRVQVKTAFEREVNGRTIYRAELRPRSRGSKASYSSDEVDVFAIHNPYLDEIYWLDVEDAPNSEAARGVDGWQEHKIAANI